MNSQDFIEIIFLAGIAGFIIFRMYGVLGQKIDIEKDPNQPDPYGKPTPAEEPIDQVVEDPSHTSIPQESAYIDPFTQRGLKNIQKIDTYFDPETFLEESKEDDRYFDRISESPIYPRLFIILKIKCNSNACLDSCDVLLSSNK